MLLLAGCGEGTLAPTPFLPPVGSPFVPSPTPPSAELYSLLPTFPPPGGALPQAASCRNDLRFLADVTIPDGTLVAPGSLLDKQWRVKNSGDCNWNEHYRLRLVGGEALGAAPEQALYPARAGAEVILRIQFVAPLEAASYRSEWQAYAPDNTPFGDPVYMEITVSP